MTTIILIASFVPLIGFAAAAARVSPGRSDRVPLVERDATRSLPPTPANGRSTLP